MNKFLEISVLLIEDDPMVQEVNRQFIERVEGFKVVETADNGKAGFDAVQRLKPDLIVLDIFMPEKDGLDLIAELRMKQVYADILVITAANDKETIRTMLMNGVIDYIIKPFKFERIQRALERYRGLSEKLRDGGKMKQEELDRLFHMTGSDQQMLKSYGGELPKGLNLQTLNQIIRYLDKQDSPLSAEEAADGIGIARVTARRYLDYLGKAGDVEIDVQYGGVGRPVNRYRLIERSI